ncbi:MAG: hypothetical protein ACRDP6_31540 [Actinoallomurus sp.]
MRVLTTAVVAALVLAGCSSAKDKAADTAGTTVPAPAASRPASPTPKSDRRTITYRLDGTAGSTDLSYTTKSALKKEKGTPLPWTKTFTVARDEQMLLSVSALSVGGGTVRCEIDVDGVKIKEDAGKELDIVTCERTLTPAKK